MHGSVPRPRRARAQVDVRVLTEDQVHDLIVAMNMAPDSSGDGCCSICKALGQEVLSDGSIRQTP